MIARYCERVNFWFARGSLLVPLSLLAGCASARGPASPAAEPSRDPPPLYEPSAAAHAGYRLVPASIHAISAWGVEPDGSTRGIVAGVRVIVRPDGGIRSASDVLPSGPTDVVALPARMGDGFLFAIRGRIWQSDHWLGEVRPLASTESAHLKLFVGLDRVYAWQSGWLAAIDPVKRALVNRVRFHPRRPSLGLQPWTDGERPPSPTFAVRS